MKSETSFSQIQDQNFDNSETTSSFLDASSLYAIGHRMNLSRIEPIFKPLIKTQNQLTTFNQSTPNNLYPNVLSNPIYDDKFDTSTNVTADDLITEIYMTNPVQLKDFYPQYTTSGIKPTQPPTKTWSQLQDEKSSNIKN